MRSLARVVAMFIACVGCRTQTPPVVVHPDPVPVPVPRTEPKVPPEAAEPALMPSPDVAALHDVAIAAAASVGLTRSPRAMGPRVGGPQPGRKRVRSRFDARTIKGQPRLLDFSRMYVTRAPWAEILEDGTLIVRWRTEDAAPPASLFLGMRVEEDPFVSPRYRTQVIETQKRPRRKHEVRSDLQRLLKAEYDVNGIAKRRWGEVAWLVEAYDQRRGSTVLLKGRSGFRIEGDRFIQEPAVVIGPMVHQVTQTGFIVSFETDVPTVAAVGVADQLPVIDRVASTRHEVEVKGLEPDQAYPVQVAISDGTEATVAPLRTIRTRPSSGPVVVAIMSDSRSGPGPGYVSLSGVNAAVLRPMIADAYRRGVEAIFFPGDLSDGYSTHPDEFDWQLRSWMKTVEAVHAVVPIYTGMGNHEALTDLWSGEKYLQIDKEGSDSAEAHFAALMVNPGGAPPPEADGAPTYDEAVYSVDLGPVHFVMLNTNYWYINRPGHPLAQDKGNREGVLMENQLQWLEADLEAARKAGAKHLVVMGHEPAFPVGGHAEDGMWWYGHIPEVNETRERFWKILAEHDVVAYISGDEHNYSRALIGPETVRGAKHSVYSIITGGCGAPYYAQDTPIEYVRRVQKFSAQQHYTLWTFDEHEAPRLQVIGFSGEVIEDLRLSGRDTP